MAEQTVRFRPGLCVLTGESGAGKSVLLTALGFALGQPMPAEGVSRASEARAQASFRLQGAQLVRIHSCVHLRDRRLPRLDV